MTEKPEDVEAAERRRLFQLGWYGAPLQIVAYDPALQLFSFFRYTGSLTSLVHFILIEQPRQLPCPLDVEND